MRLAIAGGTGTVGRHVTRIAREAGHDVLVLTRAHGHDLRTGAGIDVRGVDAVIDVCGPDGRAARDPARFFAETTARLLRAEHAAHVPHHVALSIVGAAHAPYGYYRGKAVQEQLVAAGPTPWSVLRTTQFYEFAESSAVSVGPWLLSPRMRSRPVAARAVAQRLVHIATGNPLGDARTLAGPHEWRMAELLREILRHRRDGRRVLEVPLPGRFGHALRNGTILPADDADFDTLDLRTWLAESSGGTHTGPSPDGSAHGT